MIVSLIGVFTDFVECLLGQVDQYSTEKKIKKQGKGKGVSRTDAWATKYKFSVYQLKVGRRRLS